MVNCIREKLHESNSEGEQHYLFLPLSSLSVMKLLFLFSEGKQENTHTVNKRNVFLSQAILHLTMDSKFGRLQCDSYLYDYIELFKCKLIAAESKDV